MRVNPYNAEIYSYKSWRPKFLINLKSSKCFSLLFSLHLNTYDTGLRTLEMCKFFQCGDRLYTSERERNAASLLLLISLSDERAFIYPAGVQTRDVDPMSGFCWSTVYDAEPTSAQYWVTVSCLTPH